MKKMFAVLFVVGFMFAVSACGPSAKELEEQRIADSIQAADSVALVVKTDSIAKAQADSLKADSIKKAEVKK